jgi:L-seryl-tRNA(Ser) seleniumtransferase
MEKVNGKGETAARRLPSVDRVLSHPLLGEVKLSLSRELVAAAVREELVSRRERLLAGDEEVPDIEKLASAAARRAWLSVGKSLVPVINATGVIIHTNLGRAPLSDAAIEAVQQVSGYSNLEYSLDRGQRGSRYVHATEILRRVTGCEAALIVNNNAAALVLLLAAVARDREVIVSRGQLVEIGGGFRIPEILSQSGARLVEVGTTNRTYISDYERAIGPDTAMLLNVHASNFRIVGFTTSPAPDELAELAHRHNLTAADDIGSGALFDTTRYGLAPEPTVQGSLAAGMDVCLFSGDKLLGGPQCGVLAGRRDVIDALTRHPLARALRVDKMTLAALEATLLHYLKGEAEREVPVWRMISTRLDELNTRAEAWRDQLSGSGATCEVMKGMSAVGGGSLPGETLPTWLLNLTPPVEAGEFAARLRQGVAPVIVRVEEGRVMFDPRTVLPREESRLLEQVRRCLTATAD